MKWILPVLLFAALAAGQWPTPKNAMEAYDFVQDRRSEAEKLWEKKDPAGIDMLLATLPYLDAPLVRDLSAGNRYLAARRLNIELDLAQAYALRGDKAKSLDFLRKIVAEAPIPSLADFLVGEKAFDSLRVDPEFGKILSGFRVFDSLWDSPALKTPYKDNLSDAEKVAGLSKFWSEVKYNFGFPEKLLALKWDQMYLDWIPRVLAAKSTTDYYRELMLLCARLGDGHTNVYAPPQSDINAKPPLRTGLIEGRVIIQEVRSPTLEARGVRAGMEVVAVDGEPVLDYARREVEPYQSASTPQDRENRTYWYGFLRGPSKKPVRLTLQDASGNAARSNSRAAATRTSGTCLPLSGACLKATSPMWFSIALRTARWWISGGKLSRRSVKHRPSFWICASMVAATRASAFRFCAILQRLHSWDRGNANANMIRPKGHAERGWSSSIFRPIPISRDPAAIRRSRSWCWRAQQRSLRRRIFWWPGRTAAEARLSGSRAEAALANPSCSLYPEAALLAYAQRKTRSRTAPTGWEKGSIPTSWCIPFLPTFAREETPRLIGRWRS
jgi:hypothetical protein